MGRYRISVDLVVPDNHEWLTISILNEMMNACVSAVKMEIPEEPSVRRSADVERTGLNIHSHNHITEGSLCRDCMREAADGAPWETGDRFEIKPVIIDG